MKVTGKSLWRLGRGRDRYRNGSKVIDTYNIAYTVKQTETYSDNSVNITQDKIDFNIKTC